MDFKEKIEERSLDAKSVFVASFLAGLNEFGVLNQAVMEIASRRAGKYLAIYMEEKGLTKIDKSKNFEEQVKQLLMSLNSKLSISTDIIVEEKDNNLLVKIRSSKCKFCPKGVGEAELEGTICPFPGLIEEFINYFCNKKVKVASKNNKIVRKEDDWCLTEYKFLVK